MRASATLVPGTLRSDVLVRGRFHLTTDEPESVGGDDTAPAPHELVPAALAGCVATTLAMYARTKEWELGELTVAVDYDTKATPRRFAIAIELDGDLTGEQLDRLERVAASCPVRRAVEAGIEFVETIAVRRPALAAGGVS